MVNGNSLKNNIIFWRAVALMVIAFLSLGTIINAKKIGDEELKEISTILDISNFPFSEEYNSDQLKKVLNEVINYREEETTYGTMILGIYSEVEFIDSILSQAFLNESRAYFNSVLEKRIDLFKYWKKTGQTMYKIWQQGKSVTPLTALALESAEIVDKTMNIFEAFEALKDTKKYRGLWRYLDTRINGESREWAWELARAEMQWASSPELGEQFSALYDKWGPYMTPHGISEEYKKQLASELRDTLAVALDVHDFVAEESKPSFIDKLVQQLNRIKNALATAISQINPFSAGPVVDLPQTVEELIDIEFQSDEELIETESQLISPQPIKAQLTLSEIQDNLDDILEEVDIIDKKTENLLEARLPIEEEIELIDIEPQLDEAPQPEEELIETEPQSDELEDTAQVICERSVGDLPSRFRVLINEVAWAGTDNSASDEWIELRNIWGLPVELSGWQLLDKDKQIEIVFSEEHVIPPNGFFLLERTDDNSIPNINANLIYTGSLNNSNEALYLLDENCKLEDEVKAEPNWPAGDNIQKKSMERSDILYWHSGLGTPGKENSLPPALSYVEVVDEVQNQNPVLASEPENSSFLSIIINEVAWSGTMASAFDEWIELYNYATSSVDITGWRLSSSDTEGPDIVFSSSTTIVPAQGFYLIERTDDNAISDMPAGWFGSFGNGLSNTNCETLSLYDNNNNLIDSTACLGNDWPGGEAGPNYISMERISLSLGNYPANWSNNNLIIKNGLDADGNSINGTPNGENSIFKPFTEISGVLNITDDFTLTLAGSPYLIGGSIVVAHGAKLIIEPGVIIKFKHNNAWISELKVEGELEAIGGDDLNKKIVFTSFYDDEYGGDTNNDATNTQAMAGDWNWLYFKDSQSTLKNVIIRYAGKREGNPPENAYFTRGAVWIDGGQIMIANSIIEKSQTLGVWINNSSSTSISKSEFNDINTAWLKPAAVYIESSSPRISNSTFNGNNIGILVERFSAPIIENNTFKNNQIPIKINSLLPDISGVTVNNNNYNGVYLDGLAFPEGQTSMLWPNINVPYIVKTLNLSYGLTIEVEPGVIIKFLSRGRLNLNGKFEAKGTDSEKIIFTYIYDDEFGGDTNNDSTSTQSRAGSWHHIYFSASSTDSILDNVIVRYGGWYNVFLGGVNAKGGAIKVNNNTLIIKNSIIDNNLYSGLELNNSEATIQNTIFKNHDFEYTFGLKSTGIFMENSTVDFINTFFNNNYYGIYIKSGDCPGLSGAIFETGEEKNAVNVYPSSCAP